MIFVLLRLIVVIAAPSFGSETQSFAMPGGAHLQSMFTPDPLWACCLLSWLSVDTFLFFFLSTTVKSALSFCTAGADCGLSALPPNTLANVGDEGWGGSGEGGFNPAYLAIFMHAITSGRAKTPVQFKMNYLMHLP